MFGFLKRAFSRVVKAVIGTVTYATGLMVGVGIAVWVGMFIGLIPRW